MKRFLSALTLHCKQALTVALALFFLLATTACDRATAMDKLTGNEPNPPGRIQPYEGGMNNFRDVNPDRVNAKDADTAAKALKDTVERRINTKGADSVEQYVDNFKSGTPLDERVKNIGKDLRDSTEDAATDVKAVGDRSAKSLKQSAQGTANNLDRTVDKTKVNAKSATKDASRAADKVGDAVSEGSESLADKAKRGADRAIDTVKDKANTVIENTKDALD